MFRLSARLVCAITLGNQSRFLGKGKIQLITLHIKSRLCIGRRNFKQYLSFLDVLTFADQNVLNQPSFQVLHGFIRQTRSKPPFSSCAQMYGYSSCSAKCRSM